jgi:hypothetical protein
MHRWPCHPARNSQPCTLKPALSHLRTQKMLLVAKVSQVPGDPSCLCDETRPNEELSPRPCCSGAFSSTSPTSSLQKNLSLQRTDYVGAEFCCIISLLASQPHTCMCPNTLLSTKEVSRSSVLLVPSSTDSWTNHGLPRKMGYKSPHVWAAVAVSLCVFADGALEYRSSHGLGFGFAAKLREPSKTCQQGATCALQNGRQRQAASSLSTVCMSKKDQRYKLAKRGAQEDQLLLTVAEQFRRREGQATISWYPGHIARAEKELQEVPCQHSMDTSVVSFRSHLLFAGAQQGRCCS